MNDEYTPQNNTQVSSVPIRAQEKLSFWTLLITLGLIPLFFIPSSSVSILISKNSLLVIGIILSVIMLSIGVLRDGRISIPKTYILWMVILLPVAYLAASYSSISRNLSFFGYSLDVGTFASILILFLLLITTVLTLSTRDRLFKLFGVLFISFVLVGIFALIKLFSGGNLLVLNNFSGNLGNPIGNWTDYSIYFSLFATLSIAALEWLQIRRPLRFVLYFTLLVSVFMLAVINFSIAWILTLVGSLLILIYGIYKNFGAVEPSSGKTVINNSKYSIGLTVLALLFVLNPTISSSGSIGTTVSSWFDIQNSEVRPSWGATIDVTKPILKSDPMFGSGPNTFGSEWLLNKPSVINGTAFWNVAFPFGIGFIPTQLASTGLVGGIMWALFLILFLVLGFKALIKRAPAEGDRFLVVGSFIGSLLLWISAILYVPSLVILVLTFVLTGVFIASLATSGIINTKVVNFAGSAKKNLLAIFVIIVVLLGAATFGFKSFQKTVSVVHFQKALVAANSGTASAESIKAEINKALRFSPQDIYYRALSTLAFTEAQALANTTPPQADTLQKFQTAYGQAVENAQLARDLNPGNYENWVALGALYEALVPAPLSVSGAYENAKDAYTKAQELNPQSPEIPLMLARLEASNKNLEAARKYIEQSLSLKNDYAAAYFLLARLEIGANNMATAIKAAEAGAILSPGNAGVFFELGLLKYTNKDFLGAAGAFIEALKVVPDYANAQYFLGLSLYELGYKDEALQQFLALQKSNPDNLEVQTIIANLQAGKAPFFPSTNKNVGPSAQTNPPLESAPKR